jgi:hypothetical protein
MSNEYDVNSLLQTLPSGQNYAGSSEYTVGDLLNTIEPYKEPSIVSPSRVSGKNVLKGMEYFATGGPFGVKKFKEGAQEVASLLDTTIGSAIPSTASYVTQAVARPFTTSERAAEIASNVGSALDKPFGKAFGITEEPAYKQEASNRFMNFVGENMGKGADWIAKQTGLPKADVEHMMNSLTILGTHQAVQYGKPIVKGAVENLQNRFEQAKADLSGVKPTVEPNAPVGAVAPENGVPSVVPAPKATVEVSQPTAPILERKIEIPTEMPENRAEVNPFKPEDISAREQLLNKIGIEDVRLSALEGNPKEAASQFITSQADQGPYGSGMTQQINLEKQALDNHFNKIQEEAGGRVIRYDTPFQEGDKIKVGRTIKDALQEGYDNHATETKGLYKEATDTLGKTPVELKGFNEFLNANENFAYQNEKGLQTGIKQFMNRKGFLDEGGNVKPLTVAQAEEVRQYINSKYHYETKQLGGQLKGLLDNDVFETVGGETYQKARKHYQKGIEVYDNPKAMGNLLGDEGVNQKISDEKVASTVVNLPHSQFEHLFNTLESDGQTTAINQLKTSLVEQIKEAGRSAKNQPFNSVAAAKEAANLGEKLNVSFRNDPKGLEAIYDGIEAANILHIPNKYPGAGVQTHLLKNKFSEMAIQRAGALTGGAAGSFFGPIGAGVGAAGGEYLGEKGASKLKSSRQAEQLQKEIKRSGKLSDLTNPYEIKE